MTRSVQYTLGGFLGLVWFLWAGHTQAESNENTSPPPNAQKTPQQTPWLGASRQMHWASRSASVRCLIFCAPPVKSNPNRCNNGQDDPKNHRRCDDRRDNNRRDNDRRDTYRRDDDRRDTYRRDDDRRDDDRRDNYRRDDDRRDDDRRDGRPLHPPKDPTARNLIIAGWAMFGGAYLTTMLVALPFLGAGVHEPYIGLLFVPLVGPFIGLGYAVDGVGRVSGAGAQFLAGLAAFFYGVLGFISGLTQLTGLIMAIIGHTRYNVSASAQRASNEPTWHIVPYARQYDGHQEAGVAVSGRF